ncbi:MAG: glucosaminidase domain-containing protein [Saprospirales bacterium]|nr:glucosaminidase domain-containing protein [Saprospirales bacterium]MBK8920691.1 glucosaminidase domain-containing protein [Saprospirales bacterium]
MMLEFIKKRWFTLALLLIFGIALARKNLHFDIKQPKAPAIPEKQEKYTRETPASQSAALLHLGNDGAAAPARLPEISDATAVAFLRRFSRVAVAEQQKFGIPASVMLASAYVNSFAGQRNCALEANNFQAVRCTAEWGGPVATLSGACFRKYETAWESIRDFNLYLQQRNWFNKLKKSAGADWRAWAKGLATHRASDVEDFEAELVKVIEAYRLFELD